MSLVNYYNLLDIAPAADAEIIRAAVRKQRREWRNRAAHPKAETRALAEKMTQQISDAERILLDPSARNEYDRQLAAQVPEPTHVGPTSGAAQDLIDLARRYLANGNPAQASATATQAIQRNPHDAESWYLKGVCSGLLGLLADADSELIEAIRLDPNNSMYHGERGDLLSGAEQWQIAQTCYERAIALSPSDDYYWVGLATSLAAQGRTSEALTAIEEVVKRDPDNLSNKETFAFILLEHLTAQWSQFGDGSRSILTAAQLESSKALLARVDSLGVDTPQLRVDLFEIRRLVKDAGEVRWGAPGWKRNRKGVSAFVRSTGLQ